MPGGDFYYNYAANTTCLFAKNVFVGAENSHVENIQALYLNKKKTLKKKNGQQAA